MSYSKRAVLLALLLGACSDPVEAPTSGGVTDSGEPDTPAADALTDATNEPDTPAPQPDAADAPHDSDVPDAPHNSDVPDARAVPDLPLPDAGCTSAESCDDGQPCTIDSCDESTGQCVHEVLECPPPPACHEPVECTFALGGCPETYPTLVNGSLCDDGDECTTNDYCQDAQCAGFPLNCDDDNPCTADACVAGVCEYTPDDAASCDDGDPCTLDDACSGGVCAGEEMQCALDIPCFEGVCDPATGVCSPQPLPPGSSCDDGDPCTLDDACDAEATCVPGQLLTCPDDGPCSVPGDCDPDGAGCDAPVAAPDGTLCEDGDLCTVGDLCAAGACQPGASKGCDDGLECTLDLCNATTGECINEPVDCPPGCSEDVDCNDNNVCTTDLCVDSVCVWLDNDGVSCNDVNACTQVDICSQGECVGTSPIVCTTAEACKAPGECEPLTGLCNDPTPLPNSTPCTDGNVCTTDDNCLGGECVGTPTPCNDGDTCTDDECDPVLGCQWTPKPPKTCCKETPGVPGCGNDACQACVCNNYAGCCGTDWFFVCVDCAKGIGCPVCQDLCACDDCE